MKYCPSCRNEFDDAADRCLKCDEDLVGSIEELERIGKSVVYLGVNVADAEFVLEVLKTHDIQAALDTRNIFGHGPEAVVVSDELAAAAADLLDSSGIVIEEDEESSQVILPPSCPTCRDQLISVAKFDKLAEAEEVKSLLESHGIPAMVENIHASQAIPLTSIAIPIELKIPGSYARRAAEVLRKHSDNISLHGSDNKKHRSVWGGLGVLMYPIVFLPLFLFYALLWLLTLPFRGKKTHTDEGRQ